VTAAGFLLVFLAALIGGAVNSIAGGGTLITFPAIVWLGVPPISANATSTVALWPGSFGSMWAYRDELRGARTWLTWFTVPSIAGSVVGAQLLLHTAPDRFDAIVPFLVLGGRCSSCCSSHSAAGWSAGRRRSRTDARCSRALPGG